MNGQMYTLKFSYEKMNYIKVYHCHFMFNTKHELIHYRHQIIKPRMTPRFISVLSVARTMGTPRVKILKALSWSIWCTCFSFYFQ